ncbi:hypothetical protein FB446DRAFT_720904 [Lentinula raphanica]|nr:hypothetical protein FB446DRAFT_720904 [Lentinula raphanica]
MNLSHDLQRSNCYDGWCTVQTFYITLSCETEQADIARACAAGPTLDPMAVWTVGFVVATVSKTKMSGGYRTTRSGDKPPYSWSPVRGPRGAPNGAKVSSASAAYKGIFVTLGEVVMSTKARRAVSNVVNQKIKESNSGMMPNIIFLHRVLWYLDVCLRSFTGHTDSRRVVSLSFDFTKSWQKPYFDVMVELKGTAAGSIVTKEDWEWNSYNLILENPDDPQWMEIWKKFDELRQGSVVQKAG